MDIVQRLIIVTLLMLAGVAQAADAKKVYLVGTTVYETAQSAIDAYIVSANQNLTIYKLTIGVVKNNPATGLLTADINRDDGGINRDVSIAAIRYRCNGTTVPLFQEPYAGCEPDPDPPECQQGRLLESGPFADSDGDGVLPPLSCIRGCYAHLTNGGGAPQMDCAIGGAGTIGVCSYVLPGDYIDQGESCSPDNSPTKTPPADRGPCPACDCMQSGGSWGQINGVDACMPRGAAGTLPVQTKPAPTIKEDKPKPTPENPDPEGTKTVTPSPTVTVIPNPNGGEPTVKEETTNPDGSTTTTTSTMGEYCKNNATSSTCKATGTGAGGSGGGDFKGSCEMDYVCTGDGVQCAIAKKIHQNRCDDLAELKEFEPAAEEGRRILMGEEDPDVKSWMNKEGDNKRTINLADEVKETGDYQFAAQCISDVQFSIGGHSISVPFSKLCPYFEMIGYILLAASYLYALRIVGIW